VGEFIAARATGGDLEVQTRQVAFPGSRRVSVNTAVAMNVAGDRLGVYLTAAGPEVHLNTVVTPLAGNLHLTHGGTLNRLDDGEITVMWPDGSEALLYQIGPWAFRVSMHLADARQGRIQGLLGNFDGDKTNDLALRGGGSIATPTFESLYPQFSDSWRITQSESLFDYGSGQNTVAFTDRTFPDQSVSATNLPNRDPAEAICRQTGVTDQQLLDDCTLDVSLTGQIAFATSVADAEVLVGSGSTTLTIAQPGAVASLTFQGTKGQKVFVDVPTSTLPDQCGVLTLRGPDNAAVASGCIISGKGLIDGTTLPSTGQYTIVVDPADRGIGNARLHLHT
jgi:hypothetical protein